MKVLLLGGTVFLGRHLVDALQARGHEVTLFNRGRSDAALLGEFEQLRGDRALGEHGLAALRGRRWDAAIDTCGFVPRIVAASAALLRDAVSHYTFVSSISVYADFSRPGLDETAPIAPLADPASEDVPAHYGALKAACERVVERHFPGRAFIVRPGLIVGPHDPTGRFTYWVERAARGGAMLAPGSADAAVQFIDARDLADWIVRAVDRRVVGTYNATGRPVPFGEVLDACIRAAGGAAAPVWVGAEFLRAHGVAPWTELPLWVGAEDAGIHAVDVARAFAAGLATRPVDDTVRATLAWLHSGGAGRSSARHPPAGLAPAREQALLAAWRAR